MAIPARELSQIQVLILAGGLGTRLRSAFDSGPKSMAPVGGRPFLEYFLRQVSRAGFRDVLLCVGYGQKLIEQWAGNGTRWGLSIRYSAELEPRGTGGAVKLAARWIDGDTFVVLNGDSFLAVDFRELVQSHFTSRAWATIALARVRDAGRYGTVIMTAQGEIRGFLEKSPMPAKAENGGHLVNGGIYVFQRSVLNLVPELGTVSLECEVFPQLLAQGVKGFVSDGYFIDIGLPADFKRAQAQLAERF